MSKFGVTILCLVVFALGFVVAKAVEMQSREIPTISMSKMDIEKTLSISGYIEPERVIDVRSMISGTLSSLKVEVGDVVKQNTPLAAISFVKDPIEVLKMKDNIEISKKKLDFLTTQFLSSENLYNEGFLAKEEYESLKTEYEVTKKNHETLETELAMITNGYTADKISNIINATNDGTIIELPIKEGGSVMARGAYSEGSVIARIADFSSMAFEGDVSEIDVKWISVGASLDITISTSPETIIHGRIKSISPTASHTKDIVTYKIYAIIDQQDMASTTIYSGCSAMASLIVQRVENIWALDEKYIHYKGDSAYVEIVDAKQKVKDTYVKLGLSDGIYTQIVSGIDSVSKIKAE